MHDNVQPTPDDRDQAGNEQAAVRRSVDAQFPAVAAFLAEGDARPDADLMRVDAPQVNGPRVHTIPLHNAPGATLTVTCPEWCVSDHREEVEHGAYAGDFSHLGAQVELAPGGEAILSACLAQSPFSSGERKPVVSTWPVTNGDLDERGLWDLASQLRAYADDLDDLVVDLMNARSTNPGEGQVDAAADEESVNTRDLEAMVAEYEQACPGWLAPFEGLSAERLDRLETPDNTDAPTELVAELMGTLTVWRERLRELEAAAEGRDEFRSGLDSQRKLWKALYNRTTDAFTRWYLDGWTVLPGTADTTEETGR
ncbi:DUF6907 domain-containing protein [Streptomyces sp. NPDC005808]|uniref:DUF6907 domain-containing protein n=1 Tax=Streptomyces sp. NPDC005808 TaxID=3364734 RepID=UPI0036A35C97